MNSNDQLIRYHIRLQGHFDAHRLRWFEDLEVSRRPEGETVISGALDQAGLHGVLNRIRDMGVVLIAVEREENG
ncbi:MAG: hypothetical protein ACLFVO_24580 [Chloroflexaceae bacterium]